jgi:hypothetical protein
LGNLDWIPARIAASSAHTALAITKSAQVASTVNRLSM